MDVLLERYLSETTNVAVIVTDASGAIEWCNDGFNRLSGYTLDEVRGRTPGQVLQGPGTDRATVERIRAELRANRAFRTELLNYSKSGEPYWISFEAHPIFDDSGRVVNFVAFEYDVTELKASEQSAFERAERGAHLTRFAQTAITEKSEAGLVEHAAACLGSGLGAVSWVVREGGDADGVSEDVGGRTLSVRIPDAGRVVALEFERRPPGDAECSAFVRSVTDLCTQALGRLRAEAEAEGLRSVLEQRVSERTRALRVANEELSKEVLERKEAERVARFAQGELRSILDDLSQVVVTLDGAGGIAHVNRAGVVFFDSLSHPDSAVHIGTVLESHLLSIGGGLGAGARGLADAVGMVRSGQLHSTVVQVDFEPGGDSATYQARVKRIDEAGMSRIVVTLEDVTEAKRREKRALEQTAAMGHIARLETMGELAAAMAHELNQPLAAVSNYISGTARLMRSKGIDDAALFDAMERALVQSRRAAEIIKRIRSFSRADASTRRLLNVNDVVTESIELMRPDSRLRGVLIVASLSPGLPPVSIDPIQIEQVCINLLRNSMEAVGGLDQSRRTVRIVTRASEDMGEVLVRVEDRGNGIPPEKLETLFDPFISESRSGLGLGLSICRSLIEAHGGRIWAESEVGSGSSFEFRLPAKPMSREADTVFDRHAQARVQGA